MRPTLFILAVVAIVGSDQLTKWVVMLRVPRTGVPLLGGYVSLTPTFNTGGAFSLFQARNGVFVAVALAAVAALVFTYCRLSRSDTITAAALALALGGALGNLIDRVQFGYVRDFFDIHTADHRNLWPVFNIADSAITVAMALLAWSILRAGRPDRAHVSAPDGP